MLLGDVKQKFRVGIKSLLEEESLGLELDCSQLERKDLQVEDFPRVFEEILGTATE